MFDQISLAFFLKYMLKYVHPFWHSFSRKTDIISAKFQGHSFLTQVDSYSQRQPSAVNYQTGKEVVEKDFDFSTAPRPRETQEFGLAEGAIFCGKEVVLPKTEDI